MCSGSVKGPFRRSPVVTPEKESIKEPLETVLSNDHKLVMGSSKQSAQAAGRNNQDGEKGNHRGFEFAQG